MYMYVYTPVNSCCQHVKLLYSPENDRHFRETQKVFLMSIYQLALANEEAKSCPGVYVEQGAAYWSEAYMPVNIPRSIAAAMHAS